MTAIWRHTVLLLAGSLLVMAAGFWMVRSARSAARRPQELVATEKALHRLGGAAGIAARQRALRGLLARLELERVAQSADAGAFSRRLEAILGELGLSVTSSSEWKGVPELKLPGAAAFERTFAGTGGFADLLRAIRTIESWPDRARIRALTVTFAAAGQVDWRLEISVVRLASRKEG